MFLVDTTENTSGREFTCDTKNFVPYDHGGVFLEGENMTYVVFAYPTRGITVTSVALDQPFELPSQITVPTNFFRRTLWEVPPSFLERLRGKVTVEWQNMASLPQLCGYPLNPTTVSIAIDVR
jgi:hypothetical protein